MINAKEYSLHVVGLLLLQRSTNCTHSSCPPQWGPVSTVFWAGRPSDNDNDNDNDNSFIKHKCSNE